jgi:hypothetical protein
MVILLNIRQVIEINELVTDDGIVESKSGSDQQETKDEDAIFAGRWHVDEWRRLRWLKVGRFLKTMFHHCC